MTLEELRQKKIAILGYGVNNRALVAFLLEQGMSLTIREQRLELQVDLGPQVTWQIMPNILKGLSGFDVVFRSPAIPVLSGPLQKTKAKVYSQTKLFFDLCPAQIIGITGTKGKGTTASLIYNILRSGYQRGNVYLAGNIGRDPFEFFNQLTENDVVILELSSFQLQDLHKSPHVAVVLEVGVDHLDHHKSVEEYREAKKNLLRYQTENDSAIINIQNPAMQEFLGLSRGMVYAYERRTPRRQSAWADGHQGKETVFVQVGSEIQSLDITGRKLLGGHNLENILPAVLVGSLYNIDAAVMEQEVVAFAGLEHRLHRVGDFNGVSFYDDSIATTPDATLAALQSFGNQRLHLITGGDDKGSDYTALAHFAMKRCASVSLLPGTATKKIMTLLKKQQRVQKSTCLILEEARPPWFPTILSGIQPHLKTGDVVLLSPGGSSFSAFKNAKERGDLFIQAVEQRYNRSQSL